MSPEQMQGRAKSPAQFIVASRAVSPANGSMDAYGGSPNIVGVTMGINGISGRQSPAVDRSKPPGDAFYNGSVNGHHHSSSRAGSVTNVTADLLRDLKTKDIELEGLKRQMIWMKEALGKASRSGYVYVDRDGNAGTNEISDADDGKVTEIVLKFKQFKAQVQVRQHLPSINGDANHFIDHHGRKSEANFRARCRPRTDETQCDAGGCLLSIQADGVGILE
jgi:hypothetical protein